MARRFIVNEKDIKKIDDTKFEIFGSEVKHIQVNRKNIGDIIKLNDYECKIQSIKKESIILEIIKEIEKQGEPYINLTLYIALLKGEKMDLAIQKAVEIGVKKIVPFFCKNVVVKLKDSELLKKKERFQKISNEACKQCGRTDLAEISDILTFDDMLKDIKNQEAVFFAYEDSSVNLKDEISKYDKKQLTNIACIIGPEGGFEQEEVDNISNKENVNNISLGRRILRAETAAISLCSILMYEFES